MTRITIIAGAGQDKEGQDIFLTQRAIARTRIIDLGVEVFGGLTIIDSAGAWRNGEGRPVVEPGFTIQILTDAGKAERHGPAFAVFVRDALNQACVVYVVEEVKARFI